MGVRWGSGMGYGGWCVCVLVHGMAALLGSWKRGKQENTALVPSTSRSRRECVPGWRNIFPRGLWDVGTLGEKSRCCAAPGSAPGAGPRCKWCSAVTDSTQGCSVHHPLTVPWDRPQGFPFLPAEPRLACREKQDSDGL